MERLKVGVFESDHVLLNTYKLYLERKELEVVLHEPSFGEAWPAIEAHEGPLHGALVDLDPGAHRPEEKETEELIKLLREKFGETVKIVSVLSSGVPAEGADKHLEKTDLQGFVDYIKEQGQ